MNKSPYIIAEIGSNHCGDRNIGIKHIEYAAKSGVNAVKFQLLNIRKQYSNPSQDIKKIHNVADISINDLRIFKKTADINNVDFMCSGTFLEAVEIIEALNPSFHKIASAQVPHFPQYIEKIKLTGRKTIWQQDKTQKTKRNSKILRVGLRLRMRLLRRKSSHP